MPELRVGSPSLSMPIKALQLLSPLVTNSVPAHLLMQNGKTLKMAQHALLETIKLQEHSFGEQLTECLFKQYLLNQA